LRLTNAALRGGRVALVTGGSRGLGRGIAVALGAAGWTVWVTGRSNRADGTTSHLPGTVEQTAEAVTAVAEAVIEGNIVVGSDLNSRPTTRHISPIDGHLMLVVDALEGRPGIGSARFVSPSATDEERYREVLRLMSEVPDGRRQARFVCCLVLARKLLSWPPVSCSRKASSPLAKRSSEPMPARACC
jgi:NAD(P)-dependent dehydrogenase (short-subunit alcohol dehydrogenase family)